MSEGEMLIQINYCKTDLSLLVNFKNKYNGHNENLFSNIKINLNQVDN